MFNQKKLFVSMPAVVPVAVAITIAVMTIAGISIAAAGDASTDRGAAAQSADAAVQRAEDEAAQSRGDAAVRNADAIGLTTEEKDTLEASVRWEENTGEEAETAGRAEQTENATENTENTENAEDTEQTESTENVAEDTESIETAESAAEDTENAEEPETGDKSGVKPENAAAMTTEDIWSAVYAGLRYKSEASGETLAALALAQAKQQNLELMGSRTDRVVNYHGTRYVISEDEYEVLLRIVEAEAPSEDIRGRMLVANVVLNRVHAEQFPDTISEVVFQEGQFAPVTDGMYFKRTVSEETIEAVERVLAGEDESQGALYFVARSMARKSALKFFDEKLEFLFKHGVHEFYKEK